jgi:hypothetical protein
MDDNEIDEVFDDKEKDEDVWPTAVRPTESKRRRNLASKGVCPTH